MPKMKIHTVDAKTGLSSSKEVTVSQLPNLPAHTEPKGIDFDKLKEVLLSKGIIANKAEVE